MEIAVIVAVQLTASLLQNPSHFKFACGKVGGFPLIVLYRLWIYVRLVMNSTETKVFEDVVEMLKKVYLKDIRLKGNAISYALPYHTNKAGKVQAVRGSRLGSRFTVAGIRQYMQEKEQKQVKYRRTMQDIEGAKQYLDDYEEWREEAKKDRDLFYEAFDRFQADHDVSENDEEIFYGSVFQEFDDQWQEKSQAVSEKNRGNQRGKSFVE